jgi:DNA-binding GntR family transcriptional regulator
MAESRVLMGLIKDLADNLYRFRVSLLSDEDAARRSLADHRRMLKALQRGDAAGAAKACREHILAGGRWMVAHLSSEQEGDAQHG